MQEITGMIKEETEKAIRLETETTKIWIPKRAIIDIEPDMEDDNLVTYLIQDWVDLG